MGCIGEDNTDCTYQHIHFSYYGDGSTNLFQQKMQHLNLLVFDDEGRLVKQVFVDSQQIAQSYSYRLYLPQGAYELWAIANNQATYTAIHIPQKEGVRDSISIDTQTHGAHTAINQSPLYIGHTQLYSLANTSQETHLTLYNKNHFKLKIELEGVDNLAQYPEDISVVIKNIPAQLSTRETQEVELINIQPQLHIIRSSTLETDLLSLFRPYDLDDSTIEIYSGHTLIQQISLSELMQRYPTLSWDSQELCFTVRFEFKQLDVLVTIPSWTTDSLDPNYN